MNPYFIGSEDLLTAAEYGNIQVLRQAIEYGVDVNEVYRLEDTLLHAAARNGRTECVRLLLNSKANPDVIDRYGVTALYWAATYNYPDCVRALIDAGANPLVSDRIGQSARHMAASDEIRRMIDAQEQRRNVGTYTKSAAPRRPRKMH